MTLETANRLYELRKKNNLSQEELAEKLGVSRQAVSKWERSEASPDTDNLIALAKIYNLSLDELIFGEKENTEEKNEERNEERNEEKSNEESTDEDVLIDINEENGNRVVITPWGVTVNKKDGKKVNVTLKGIRIETEDDEDEEDDEDDENYETVYVSKGDTSNGKKVYVKIRKATRFWLEVPYAVICAIAYLLCGFYNVFGGWSLSWVIFITVPIYYSFVEAIYNRKFSEFAYPVFCTFVYLIFGLYYHNWHPSWVIFVTIPVYYPIASALDKLIRNKQN